MRSLLFRNVEGEAGCKQRPGHLWEGKQQECAAAKGVDGKESRPGEDEVHQAEAEGR